VWQGRGVSYFSLKATFPSGTMGILTLPPVGRKKVAFNASTVVENQTFGVGVTKNSIVGSAVLIKLRINP